MPTRGNIRTLGALLTAAEDAVTVAELRAAIGREVETLGGKLQNDSEARRQLVASMPANKRKLVEALLPARAPHLPKGDGGRVSR